jgi:nitrous oxide reductase accessory protein NosL
MYIIKLLIPFFLTLNLFAYPEISTAVKEKKIYPMGEKVYKKLCKTISVKEYASYENMQEAIEKQKLCKKMKKRYFEALSLYLWDTKREIIVQEKAKKIDIHKDEKCPVCGMFVYKYPKWATQIFYENKHYSFDGVKDMMKYYFSHQKGIKEILVRDYYTQKVIDATKAFYVIGSDIYGPMGNELIAFSDEKSAKVFYFDHRAKKVLRFDEITSDLVHSL